MKNFRILVLTVLLGLATPFLIHYRGWASALPVRTQVHSAATKTPSSNAQSADLPPLPPPARTDLPNGNGSLPLLSVIGFGILVGGVLSALRTRQVHK